MPVLISWMLAASASTKSSILDEASAGGLQLLLITPLRLDGGFPLLKLHTRLTLEAVTSACARGFPPDGTHAGEAHFTGDHAICRGHFSQNSEMPWQATNALFRLGISALDCQTLNPSPKKQIVGVDVLRQPLRVGLAQTSEKLRQKSAMSE